MNSEINRPLTAGGSHQAGGHYQRKTGHPVIFGVGQVTHRDKIIGESLTVVDLAKLAIDACVRDTGRDDILKYVDLISVVGSFSEHRESPVAKICSKAGMNPALREESFIGGDNPQLFVNRAADRIAAGEIKAALIVGAEALYRGMNFRQVLDLDSLHKRYEQEPLVVGDVRTGETAHELLHRAFHAPRIYPLFENALRVHLNMTIAEHRELLRGYFNGMAAAAEGNPYAWFNHGSKQDNIVEPTPKNPLYNFPYTKYANPVLPVNQAAAVLMTGTQTAHRLGIPKEKWVYPRSGAEAADKWYISERVNYHSSPVIRFTVESALRTAGKGIGDIDFFDLYSCFPCAAIISAMEMGLPVNNLPPLTITGGLPYFGGPGNNYTLHSIAHAVERLRRNPEEFGMVTGVGYFLTKHSVGIYSGTEPEKPWGREPKKLVQARIDELESPVLNERPRGAATVETYTVLHESADGRPWPIIIARLDNGERCFATAEKGSDLPDRMEEEEVIGYRGFVTPGEGGPNTFR